MDKLQQLRELLRQKKSRRYYAEKLNISIEEVGKLIEQLKSGEVESGVLNYTGLWSEVPTPEAIIKRYKINLNIYRLSNTWIKDHPKGFLVSVSFLPKEKKERSSDEFTNFLKSYKSPHKPIKSNLKRSEYNGCLVINKQDSHLNKWDIGGNNDIHSRFKLVEEKTEVVLEKASLSANLEKVIYIVGSDQFNSEWTGTTVKGTPQQNVKSYHESFKLICDHEVFVINMILLYAKQVEVVYIGGNHDEFVGWHMVNWLQAYYRNQPNLKIDGGPEYTKYRRFSNTAMCFNHGDEQKPEKLAQNFPVEFKTEWSKCDHFYMFTGDKHTGISKDIGGVEWHQIAALSKAKSNWDSKNGHLVKGRMTAFLIEEGEGITDIIRRAL